MMRAFSLQISKGCLIVVFVLQILLAPLASRAMDMPNLHYAPSCAPPKSSNGKWRVNPAVGLIGRKD